MKFSCGGVLPKEIHNVAQLPSPLVLQVDQMVDLNDDDPQDNRLLLTMTDGVQFIYGEEIQHNKDLNVSLPAGFKVVIHKESILNGLTRLVPERLKVLGGMVEDFGAAHDKLMEEVIADRKPKS
ncbi:hypothetical protein MKW98_026936 [Papaver atlanticum]|uniref:RecQ-mediated genome instability protein 1 n=1 Tax=Papaver atlanticum TaxID=357466 RepID=A0AAD4SVU4_9MAGN|nr:hypothetical protein MKW98_026936 [Papaver atlanticum]